MAQLMQPSFAAGEIAPSLHARVDLAKYQTGLSTCRNFFVQSWGGVANRTGTEYVGEVKDSNRGTWLVPFQFKSDDTYVLEFGHMTMRVIRNGAYVLETGITITGISQAAQAVVTAANSYSDGDEIYLSGIAGMTQLNGRTVVVANRTAANFRIQDRAGNYINSSDFTAWSSGGTAARLYQITTPYDEDDLALLKWVQSADVMTLCHVDYAPRELTRTGHASWTLSEISFGPSVSAPSAISGVIGGGMSSGGATYSYKVTAIHEDTGEESLPTSAVDVSGDAASAWSAGEFIDVSWPSAASASQYRVYKGENGIFGYIGTAEGLTFRDDKIDPDTTDTPPVLKEPFDGASNWPGCTTYHQERQFFARTRNKPQTIFASQTGNYKNMNVSVPAKADDALTFGLVSRQVNEIRHLVPLLDLIVLTSGSEHTMRGSQQNEALTPTSIQVKPQGYRGASHVHPLIVGNNVLFVQEKGQIIRDLGYEFAADGYTGNDLTILARHLFKNREIRQMAYAQAPYSLVWCVMSDGALLSLTYLREHQVWAWARHDTDGWYESVAVVSEGQEDVPYFVVRRQIGSRQARFVERLHSREFTDARDCFFVDAGLSLDVPFTITSITSTNPAVVSTSAAHGLVAGDTIDIFDTLTVDFDPDTGEAVAHATAGNRYKVGVATEQTVTLTHKDTDANIDGTAWDAYFSGGTLRKAVTTVSGLHHLEGKTVAVLADGNVLPRRQVLNGEIMLDRAASRVHVGLPITADFATLSLDAGNGQLQGKRKTVPFVTMRVEDTRGGFLGPNFDGLDEWKQREAEDYDEPTRLFTGDFQKQLTSDWQTTARICYRQVDPLPASLLAVIPEIALGGH